MKLITAISRGLETSRGHLRTAPRAAVLLLAAAFFAAAVTPADADVLLGGNTTCRFVNQCADGFDNDSDGLIDTADGGCVTQWDSSEVQLGRQTDFLVCESFPTIIAAGQATGIDTAAPFLELIDVPGLVDLGEFGGVPDVMFEGAIVTREYVRYLSPHAQQDDPEIPNLVIEQVDLAVVEGTAELGRLQIDLPLPPTLRTIGGANDALTGEFVINEETLSLRPTTLVLDDFETGDLEVTLTPPPGSTESQLDHEAGSMVGGLRTTHFLASSPGAAALDGRLQVDPGSELIVDNEPGLSDRLEIFYGLDGQGGTAPLDLDLSAYDAIRLDFGYLDSGLNLTVQLRTGDGQIRQQSVNVFGPEGQHSLVFPMADFGLGSAIVDVDLIGLILQSGGTEFGSQYQLTELAACGGDDPACGERVLIDFDRDPDGDPIVAGADLRLSYRSLGVLFDHSGSGAICGPDVYANDDQPWAFGSAPHVVTLCEQGIASDFGETFMGMVEARLAGEAFEVCIDALPAGPGSVAILRGYDEDGVLVDEAATAPEAIGHLCVRGDGLRSVRFGGEGMSFARFDDLEARFVPEAGFGLGLAAGGLLLGLARGRRSRRAC